MQPLYKTYLLPLLCFCIVMLAGAAPTYALPSVKELRQSAPRLSAKVATLALTAFECAQKRKIGKSRYFSVIDYSLPSTEPRYWLFDLREGTLLFEELVGHGRNSGENWATTFSNRHGSKMSSLGLFETGTVYHGRNGYSLCLEGLEKGINDNAYDRAIVIHGAPYIGKSFIKKHSRLGRSWGCPVFRPEVNKGIVDTIKHGQLLFIYYPKPTYLKTSTFLQCD